MKSIIAVTIAFAGSWAMAQERPLEIVKDNVKFLNLNGDSMKPGTVYFQFTEEPQAFTDWMNSNPNEYAYLALWDGYVEPTLVTRKRQMAVTEKMTMFIAKSKSIINKPASSINLKATISLPFIQKMDSEIRHAQIAPQQIMPVMGGQPKIDNFAALCNKDGANIVRPSQELSLTALNRPGQAWCADTSRSICIESCYLFNYGYRQFIGVYNALKAENEFDKKDYGMATQSEIRYFVSDAEMGKKVPVAALTGINSPVRGVYEQSLFYFNQLVQYGKVVSVFQEHPKDASKTIVTSFIAFGIQTSTYQKTHSLAGMKFALKDVLMGKAGSVLNSGTGITAGLPIYTQNIAKSMVKMLESN